MQPATILSSGYLHYYPFGLTMAGISSKAAGGIQNKYKFNGGNELQAAEFSDGSGMELYDAVHRMYDPQLGRFWQVDELAEANWEMSTYCFASDNPISFNDPLGLVDNDPDPGKPVITPGTTMRELIITAKIPKLDSYQVSRLYYALQASGKGTDVIRNKTWRDQVKRYDAVAKWLVEYHKGVKEDGMMMLEGASWFMPVGQLTKLRYLKYASILFKSKRAIAVTTDLTGQLVSNNFDLSKINPVNTISAGLIGNPFLSNVPGSFIDFSQSAITSNNYLKSYNDLNVYKSILVGTFSNSFGNALGNETKTLVMKYSAENTTSIIFSIYNKKTDIEDK